MYILGSIFFQVLATLPSSSILQQYFELSSADEGSFYTELSDNLADDVTTTRSNSFVRGKLISDSLYTVQNAHPWYAYILTVQFRRMLAYKEHIVCPYLGRHWMKWEAFARQHGVISELAPHAKLSWSH